MIKYPLLVNLIALAQAGAAFSIAQAGQTPRNDNHPISSPIQEWWNGKYASGDWFGLRNTLEDEGLALGASWRANFLGVVSGGIEQRAGFDEEFKFFGNLDFAKLTGWAPLAGLTARAEVRWRDGDGMNKDAGTIGSFSPST